MAAQAGHTHAVQRRHLGMQGHGIAAVVQHLPVRVGVRVMVAMNKSDFYRWKVAAQGRQHLAKREVVDVDVPQEHQPARLVAGRQQGPGNVPELTMDVSQEPDASQGVGVLLVELVKLVDRVHRRSVGLSHRLKILPDILSDDYV